MRDHPRLTHVAVAALLAILVLAAYSNSIKSGFVLDNQFIVQEDPRLSDKSWQAFSLIWTRDYWYPKAISGLYRPITTTTYWVQGAVLGQRTPGPYHWVNLALHWMNCVLVYAMLRRLVGKW